MIPLLLMQQAIGQFSGKPMPDEHVEVSCVIDGFNGEKVTGLKGSVHYPLGEAHGIFRLVSSSKDYPGGDGWEDIDATDREHQRVTAFDERSNIITEYEFRFSDWPGEPSGYVAVRTHYNGRPQGSRPAGWVGAGICSLSQAPFR